MHAVRHERLHVHLLVARRNDFDSQPVLAEDALFAAEIDRQRTGEGPRRGDPQQSLCGGGNKDDPKGESEYCGDNRDVFSIHGA